MLRWRIAISVVLIPLLAAIFYADARSGPAALGLFVLCAVVALRSVWELIDLYRERHPQLNVGLLMASTVGLIYAAWWPHLVSTQAMANSTDLTSVALTFACITMVLMAAAARRFEHPGTHANLLGTELLIVTYIGFLLAVVVQLRWVAGHEAGYLAIGSLVLCVKGGDVGAYAAGKLLGTTKMAPVLSPKKTWAGAIGGICGAMIFGILWFQVATPWFLPGSTAPNWWTVMTYSALLGLAGIVGDLCESMLKRDVEQKDSAPLLPGFGGVLDLLDSLLFAGPVAYLLWLVLPMSPWLAK